MDGFEFTRTIKRDARHSHIPIIMITSRTAEKHRSLARELGVDLYLGKPFQEEELLRNLREMLAPARSAGRRPAGNCGIPVAAARRRAIPAAARATVAAAEFRRQLASGPTLEGRVMAQFATENIRTVALVGHGASGKTTLAEALLHKAGTIPAPGSVERGTTVSDFDPLEKTYQHSLRASLLHLETADTRVHLVDTPGFPDFIGQAIGALDAVETVAVVVNAQAGLEMITSRMMDWAAKRRLCRLVVVNKIDAENVDLPALLAQIQAAFGKECLPINLPADGGKRVVDCFFNPAGDADFSSVAAAHQALVDQVVEVDEELMSLYLEQGEISPSSCTRRSRRRCAKATSSRCASSRARNGAGVAELLDIIVKLLPNPTEGNPPLFYKGEGETRGGVPLRARSEEARARARVQGGHRPVRRQARRLPRAPGHGDQGHAALRRRRPQAVQGRPPVPAPGRQEHRDRPRRAGRHRRGGQGRRDRVRLRAARLARRGPHPHARRSSSRCRCTASRSRRRSAATSSGSPTCCTG